MKNIVILGMNKENGKLLQLMNKKSLLENVYLYQIVRVPGIGLKARPLEPHLLKDVSVEEVVKQADKFIAFEDLDEEIAQIVNEKDIEFISSATDNSEVADTKDIPQYKLLFQERYLPDLFGILSKLVNRGYRPYLKSNNMILDSILKLTQFRSSDADFNIIMTFSESQQALDEIDTNLFDFARKVVSKNDYHKRMKELFSSQEWDRNLHKISKEVWYFSFSRRAVRLTRKQDAFLRWLSGELSSIPKCSRNIMEQVVELCNYEHRLIRYMEAIISTRLVKISNMDNVIISFLGSRRCNFKCAYCFSDHRHEALSVMTENEMITICDILTNGKTNINIHFDNNLGGEPGKDLKGVFMRHNTAIAFHKTIGIPASFGILTNGTLISLENMKWIKTHIPYVGFSLDGDKETHDKIRKDACGNPTYHMTTSKIRMLQKSEWPVETGISSVICAYNTNIKSLQEHMRDELGVKNITMKPVRASVDEPFALTYQNLPLLMKAYKDFFASILKEGEDGNLNPLFTMLQPIDYAGRFLLRSYWGDRFIVKRCGCAEHIFSVADNGQVFPCDSFNQTDDYFEIANLKEGMHNKSNFEVPFVIHEKPEFGCNKCWARYLCGGICQYVQYLNNYKHNDVTKMECQFAKFLAKEAIWFWVEARKRWQGDILDKVSEHIKIIGVPPVSDGSYVYAPC